MILRSLFGLLLLAVFSGHAQTRVYGTIFNESGDKIPFATVYQEGSTNGTTSNSDGFYQLTFSETPANLVIQHIGYEKKVLPITSSEKEYKLDVTLSIESLVLSEVIVAANQKNHAVQIIRNTMKKRKYYRDEVAAYDCQVYIKGLQRLDKKPKNLLGRTVTVDTGVVYLSESVSRLKYLHPDKINEVMISSKVSGNDNGFSFNQASDMMINLYDNNFFVEGLSERPFISPISSNGFAYYQYEFKGTLMENGLLINKIKITPKRETDPAFTGYLYIIDGSWRLHSVDVSLTKSNGIEFIDSLNFRQVYAPVAHDIWMPISQRFQFKFNAFGFQGSGHFTAIYSRYNLTPNYWIPAPAQVADTAPKKAETTKKQTSKPKKDTFSKSILTVEEGANEKDSLYWASVRPIPLTPVEIKDYRIKDSLQIVKESKPYKDSVDEERNKLKFSNLFLSNYIHFNSYKRTYLTFPNIPQAIQYNAVEGLALNMEVTYQKRDKESYLFALRPAVRYGFSNNRFQAKLHGIKRIDLKSQEYIYGGFGRYIFQMNENEPIPAVSNSYFILTESKNYARFFEKTYLKAGYKKEIRNGIYGDFSLEYADRQPMRNTADFSFTSGSLAENSFIINAESGVITQTRHQAMVADLNFRILFDQRYIDRPDRKINLPSRFPSLLINYRKGIPLMGSDVNYDFVKVGSRYARRIGSVGESQISFWAGKFLNSKHLYFQDYQHFSGNQVYLTMLLKGDFFQMLDYYTYSTKDEFIETHFEHHFNGFMTNNLPFIKRLKVQTVATVNYLTTPTMGHYVEFGVGVEHIFRFFRLDYVNAYRNGNHIGWGLRLGAGF